MHSLLPALSTAVSAARAAGAAAMRFYGTATATAKADASPVTAADHAANDVIVAALQQAFLGDAILSEESADSPARLSARRVWIVDPLDGTKEFLAQNGEFSIMIGLAIDAEAVLGVVYLPAVDLIYAAAKGEGAWVEREAEREPLRRVAANPAALRLVGSRSHADPLVARLQEALGITDVAPCGSVGVKCTRIAHGERDLYLHPVPYLKEWDTCAPEAILREAGGSVTDCRGEPLRYNKPDPRQPHGIMACAPGVFEAAMGTWRGMYGNGEKSEVRRKKTE
jgi:3'(2'), 5'-bisphosphate nucleotidase